MCPPLFLIRAFEDEAKARLGVVECAKHELLQPFSVLHEKEGECWCSLPCVFFVCLFVFTPIWHLSLYLPTHPFVSLLSGELVAQFKFTVLLMANGSHRITSGPFDPELYKSEHEVQDPKLKVDTSLDLHGSHSTTQKLAAWNVIFISNWNSFIDFTTKLCKP